MNIDMGLVRQARRHWLPLASTVVCGILATVATIAQAASLSRVIHRVFLERAGLAETQGGLAIFVLASLARVIFTWLQQSAASQLSYAIKSRLRNQLSQHLFQVGPAQVQNERTGELSATLLAGVDALDAYFSQYLPQLLFATLIPITILVFVFPIDLISGLVLLLTAPLIPLFMVLIGHAAEALTRRQWQTLSRLSAHFLDVLQGLTVLKLFNRSRDQIKTIMTMSQNFRHATMNVLRVAFLSALVLELIATISTAIIAVEIGLRLLYNRMQLVDALFVLILAPEFYLSLRQLASRFHAGMEGVASAQRLFQLLAVPAAPIALKRSPHLQNSTIRFDAVSYAYESGSRPALQDVTLEISPGQKVALIGPSGSGKTTLTRLLLGFIAAQEGKITIGDQDLKTLNREDWWRQIGWVPQQPTLFHASVRENIALGRDQATDSEIIEAARLANIHDFIVALPEGYHTMVGEKGARLSGGQVQRIALARAFIKNAPLLILDEPIAQVDPGLSALLHDSIEKLLKNRTAIIIAHQLHTVVNASRIYVLQQGRIIESGSPAELKMNNGYYAHLLQMAGARP